MRGCIVFCVALVCGVLANLGEARAEPCRFLLDGCEEPETRRPQREFVMYPGIDFDGDDINPWLRGYDLDSCKNACANNAGCQAFTFNRRYSVCILKSGNGRRKSDADAISGSTTRISATPASFPQGGLTIAHGVDYPGGDLENSDYRGISLERCSALCSQNQQCAGFSYVRSKNWCWLKGRLYSRQSNADIISGTK